MAQAAVVQSKPAQAPVWQWKGKTKAGEERSGEIEAADEQSVRQQLARMGVEPSKVKKKAKEINFKLPGFGGVTTKDLLIFTRQFSVMIDAGLPLVQALDIIGTQAENPEFKRVLLAVKVRVESGSTFADSLSEHPQVFDELFVQLVRA